MLVSVLYLEFYIFQYCRDNAIFEFGLQREEAATVEPPNRGLELYFSLLERLSFSWIFSSVSKERKMQLRLSMYPLLKDINTALLIFCCTCLKTTGAKINFKLIKYRRVQAPITWLRTSLSCSSIRSFSACNLQWLWSEKEKAWYIGIPITCDILLVEGRVELSW